MISQGIIDHLAKRGLAAIEKENGFDAIRGSNSGKCRLQVWKKIWRWKDAMPLDAKTQARFALGHSVHEETRTIVAEAGFEITEVEGEVAFSILRPDGGWQVKGHVDGLFRAPDGVEVIDVKSCGDYPFKLAAGILQPKEGRGVVAEDHLDQLHFYRMALLERGIDTKRGRILYRCIENDEEATSCPTFPYADVPVEWDDLRCAKIALKWEDVLSRDGETPPEPDFGPIEEVVKGRKTGRKILPFECAYCPFREGPSGCYDGKVVFDEMAARAKPYPRKGIYYFPVHATPLIAQRDPETGVSLIEAQRIVNQEKSAKLDSILDQDIPLFQKGKEA